MAPEYYEQSQSSLFPDYFPELESIKQIAKLLPEDAELFTLGSIQVGKRKFPINSFELGSTDPNAPCLGFFGGVHGLERIGSQVLLAFLMSYLERLSWDEDLKKRQEQFRLIVLPVLNPAGMFYGRRSNMNGVDLMRNAPLDAEDTPLFLAGGHRLGPWMPWYRGKKKEPLQPEAQILCDYVHKKFLSRPVSLALDVHSGFGWVDRLWYPFATAKREFPHIDQAKNIKELLNRSFPNHVYAINQQSDDYIVHGDLWDYLYKEAYTEAPDRLFIPWTLEMGSWRWIKKNPLQLLLYRTGAYHPIEKHRQRRTFRRHLWLFDFFMSLVRNPKSWAFS